VDLTIPLSVTGAEKHAKAAELNKAKSENRNFAVSPQQSFIAKKEDLPPPPRLPKSIFNIVPPRLLRQKIGTHIKPMRYQNGQVDMGDTRGIRRSNDKRAFLGISLFQPLRRV
jgi:hypothetical protein